MADGKNNLKSTMDNLIKNKETLYSDIYYNTNTANREIKLIKNRLDDAIRNLSGVNVNNTGMSNISSLYSKTLSAKDKQDRDFINNLNNVLMDRTIMDNVMAVYVQNTWVRDIDAEIDMVCKYMPKLEEALKVRMNHVLSADHFSKNSIVIQSANPNSDDFVVQDNLESMDKKYNISENLTHWYYEMDKRGEVFIYIVPYRKALKELLKRKQEDMNTDGVALRVSQESIDDLFDLSSPIETRGVIQEAADEFEDLTAKAKLNAKEKEEERKLLESIGDIQISINKSGILTSALKETYQRTKFFAENSSLFFSEDGEILPEDFSQTNTDSFGKKQKDDNELATDGFVDKKREKKINITIPGCVVKQLDHTMVKPLYIDNICLGYFYIECDKKIVMEQTTFSSTIGGIRPGHYNKAGYDPYGSYGNDYSVIKNIANKIANKINAQFVNANADLAREIYYILKYNSTIDASGKVSKINITFIPPEDLKHKYFEFDYEMKRGISGIFKSLFPAKLYSCLYISNSIQLLTRGYDKRVYYVKQTVDKNISGVLGSVINQIQRSNFGIRQIESMSNVLNQIGRFNDFLIPRSQGGDAPIDMEVLPGQQVDIKSDLMNMLEEMAISVTGVPLEEINLRQQTDYATHLTMRHWQFAQDVNNRQAKVEEIFSDILTTIYNFEFNMDSNNKDLIRVTLPPPIYLNAINTAQILDSVNTVSESMSKIAFNDQEADQQVEFARLLKGELAVNLINKDIIERCKDKAKMNVSTMNQEQ